MHQKVIFYEPILAELISKLQPAFVTLLASLLISCSASSSSLRYKKPNDEKPNNTNSSVRFTSESEFDEQPPREADLENDEITERFTINSANETSISHAERMLIEILKLVNTPYQFGGESQSGMDCSAFTQRVFSDAVGIELPRTAAQQFKTGLNIGSKNDLKFGDLLFFDTTTRAYPGHVGIYLGDGLFAHASSSRGVTVSNFLSNYYSSKYVGARRIIK